MGNRVMPHLAVGVAILASLAGCGGSSHDAATPTTVTVLTTAHASTAPTPAPGMVDDGMGDGMMMPVARTGHDAKLDFNAVTLDGTPLAGSALLGHRAVLWFWAPNCSDCAREAPHLLSAAADNPDVEFIAVSGLGSAHDTRAAITRLHTTGFTQLFDADGRLWRRFGVTQQPAYAFVDPRGHVTVHRGAMSTSALAAAIAATAG